MGGGESTESFIQEGLVWAAIPLLKGEKMEAKLQIMLEDVYGNVCISCAPQGVVAS